MTLRRDPERTSAPVAPADPNTGAAPEARVTCGFCGLEFVVDPGQATCQACPLHKACGFVRCPHCGYENPQEPRWLTRIRSWIGP